VIMGEGVTGKQNTGALPFVPDWQEKCPEGEGSTCYILQ